MLLYNHHRCASSNDQEVRGEKLGLLLSARLDAAGTQAKRLLPMGRFPSAVGLEWPMAHVADGRGLPPPERKADFAIFETIRLNLQERAPGGMLDHCRGADTPGSVGFSRCGPGKSTLNH